MDKSTVSFGQVHWGYGLLGVIVVQTLMVALAFAWVFLYSLLINPGQDDAHYTAYAQIASPISALITGAPLYFLAARLIRGRIGDAAVSTALAMAALAVALDMGVTFSMASNDVQLWACLVNAPLKVAALWFGARGTR